LTYNSGSAVEWLQDKFNLDLSQVSRLGGHSQPRTHRGKERFPGMAITYALMEKFEEICRAHPDRARSITKARVTRVIMDAQGTATGVEYEREGQHLQEHGPVIIATGGYAADFTSDSILKKYRPDIYDLPTTNGDYSTGDGLKMGLSIGAAACDLEKVQVHPTGLVDPKEPDAKVKFLAAEALRGNGGILLDANGERFCDELGHRDYVTGMMNKNKGPFRLILNQKAAATIEWHCKHYMGRGLMKHYKNGSELAQEMGVSSSKLQDTFRKYNEAAKAGKPDQFGKKFFENWPVELNEEFYVAIVTPVLHFTMGGLEINEHSEVLNAQKNPITGLFACGEVAGGVHGANRLGGSSLLGCVVYGRVAGDTAARFLLGKMIKGGGAGAAGAVSVNTTVSSGGKVTLEFNFGGASAQAVAAPAPAAAAQTSEAAAAPAVLKEYTMEEVAKHNTEGDCWIVVNGEVIDATKFLKDHPGGKKAIVIYAGRDATEEFNMLHKPDVIAKFAPYTIIGKIKGGSPAHTRAKM
jgi:flavocytochrome c